MRLGILAVVCCVVILGLSYVRPGDVAVYHATQSTCFVGLWRGRVEFVRQSIEPALPAGRIADTSEFGQVGSHGHGPSGGVSVDLHSVTPGWLGFGRKKMGARSVSGTRAATVWYSLDIDLWTTPLWAFVLIAAVWPILTWSRRRRAAALRTSSRCTACGYDLRASPGRCPECGTVVRSDGH